MQNAARAVSILCVPALQNYFTAERLRRGWTMRQAAQRSQISLSKAYAIANGEDNVEFETFENIASAFGLTPAELAVAIGKGSPEDDPTEVHLLATYRQVPDERRSAVLDMVRGLAVQPIRPPRPNRRRQAEANTRRVARIEKERDLAHGDETAPGDALAPWYALRFLFQRLGQRALSPAS